MPKELDETIKQIRIMGDLAMETNYARGSNLKQRAIDDLEKIARSSWLNIYEYLSDNGISPDEHFTKVID